MTLDPTPYTLHPTPYTLHPTPYTLDPILWLLLAVAFALRTIGVSDLQLSGDAAWSVFLAMKDLPALTQATAMDSHPPLYYYLLHAWMGASGVTELSVRLPSAFMGLLTVALTYKLGWRLVGHAGGLVAGILAAISPFLVYFDRMPRMYSLLTLIATLALYLVLRLLAEAREDYPQCGVGATRTPGGRRRQLWPYLLGAYLSAALAGLYTHYYGVFIPAVGLLALAVGWLGSRRRLLALAGGHALVLVSFLPWLLYVFGPSVAATTQAYGAIDLARPPSVLALVERFWIALNLGAMWDLDQSRYMAWGLAILWAGGLAVAWLASRGRGRPAGRSLLLVPFCLVALPVAANGLVFQFTQYVPFTRLLLFSAPAYLVLLAWMLGEVWRAWRPAGSVVAFMCLALTAYALAGTFYVERGSADMEAVEAARGIAPAGRPNDGVIFQSLWHAGYFRVRTGKAGPSAYALAEVPVADLPRLLEGHPRLWLSMFASARRDPLYPQEEWLDSNAYKAGERWQGNLRLSLYGGRPDPPLEWVGADYGGVARLEEAGVAPRQVQAGDVLRLFLRWRALKDPGRKYVVFVHFVNEGGRGCTSRDSEPVEGLRPTEGWKAGQVIDDRRGILVGAGVPPGRYYLAVGLYAREDWTKRLPVNGGKEDLLLLGPVEVLPGLPAARDNPPASLPGTGLELLGYGVEPGWKNQVVRNVDGPVGLWSPGEVRPGGRLPLSLRWRASRPLAEAFRLRLGMVDASGRTRGQAPEGVLGGDCPTFRWVPGEVVSETRVISVEADAPPGQYRLRATVYPQQGDEPLGELAPLGSVRIAPN